MLVPVLSAVTHGSAHDTELTGIRVIPVPSAIPITLVTHLPHLPSGNHQCVLIVKSLFLGLSLPLFVLSLFCFLNCTCVQSNGVHLL